MATHSSSATPNPGLASCKIIAFVATRDRARSKAFYQDTLGLRLVSEDPFATVFDAHGTMLRVTPVPEIAVGKYTVLGWEVADIAATAKHLQNSGVSFERFPGLDQDELCVWSAPGGAKIAWFKDPEGHILSISQH